MRVVRARTRFASALLLGWLALGCAPRGIARGFTPLLGERGGAFVLLLRHYAPQAKPGDADSASSAAALRALWQRWRLPLSAPALDLEQEVVWVFSLHPNYETAELIELTLDSTGRVEPSIGAPDGGALTSPRSGAIVFVVAIARAELPLHPRLLLPAHASVPESETEMAGALPRPHAREPVPAALRASPPAQAIGPWLTTAPLPPRAEVGSAALPDGTQVFIVRHADGEISVLASHEVLDELAARRFSNLRGLQLPVRFRSDVRRFYGVGEYDEYGASVEGALRAPLPRHRSAIAGEFVHIGGRDDNSRLRGVARAGHEVEPGFDPIAPPSAPAPAPSSLAAAAALPEGTRVVLDAALVMRGTDAPRLCPSSAPVRACDAAQSARVLDLVPIASSSDPRDPHGPRLDMTFVIHGPLSARVARGGFVELRVPASASHESYVHENGAAEPPSPCADAENAL